MGRGAKEIKLPEFYFSFIVTWLRRTGIEVLYKEETLSYKSFSAFCLFYGIVYTAVECNELRYQKDFNSICIVSSYIAYHLMILVKLAVIYFSRKDIGNLMRSFHKGFFKPNKARGGEFEEACVSNILEKNRRQLLWYGIITLGCAMGPIVSIKLRLTEPRENWILPWISISLIDIHRSPNFEIMFCYQLVAGYYILGWAYFCDCAVISIIAQTVAQLKILENCIRNYELNSKQCVTKKRFENKSLHYAIKYHINLLDTVDVVEQLCSYLVLCVFVTGIIQLCLFMYNASLAPIKSLEFVRYVSYGGMAGVQIFMFCWWGNELTLTNRELAVGISETYNPDDSIQYSKALKLMLVKAQKPLFLTAGKFVPLSIDTFKGILKGSFSYFTVLRQVNYK